MGLNNMKRLVLFLFFIIFLLFYFKIDLLPFVVQISIGSYFIYKIYNISVKQGGSVFHPIPLVSIILFIFFLLPPLFAYHYKIGLLYITKDIDFDFYLPLISWIYLLGIILFYFGCVLGYKNIVALELKTEISNKNLLLITTFFLSISFFAQLVIFVKFGGIYGYMNAWTDDRSNFDGLGKWFMLAEPFPIILIFFIFIKYREKLRNNFYLLVLTFLIFFGSKMLFGGLRGSRSNTIWGLFWFAGLVHLYLYKLKKIHFIIGIIFLSIFMPIYGVYKTYGVDSLGGEYSISDTNRYENNPLLDIYVNDFSRASINAFQMSQYFNTDYKEKLGSTYYSSVLILLPFLKNSYTGHDKNTAGSELVYEQKMSLSYKDDFDNSRVYGVYGEGLLNFGPYAGVFLFFVFGYLVMKLDNLSRSVGKDNFLILFVPFLSNLSFVLLLSDSDNAIFFLIKNGLLPAIYIYVLYMMSIRVKFR